MTEPAPTPAFRRFPWLQLVFCIACLSMTAWTWMRYSYAWTVCDPHFAVFDESCDVTIGEGKAHPMFNRYVRATGISVPAALPPKDTDRLYQYRTSESDRRMFVINIHHTPWTEITIIGRVVSVLPETDDVLNRLGNKENLSIHEEAGRLNGANVGGLLVGAMGCFIFGLYLRAWLRERKALASEPPQDMIV